jgi:protein SCO1/2
MTRVALSCAAALLVLAAPAGLCADTARPAILRDVDFAQRIGTPLPLDVSLRDERGRTVALREYFGTTPVVLVPAYYRCPQLCTLVQNGVVSALRALSLDVGRDFQVVTFSFDPSEPTELAAAKKTAVLDAYRRQGAEAGWHFLTGDAESVRRLTEAIGFRYAYDEAHRQFAHASGIVVATPGGTVSHYLYGVEFAPRDLRLALVEASAGRLGSVADQLMLFCFMYDPATGRYSRLALGAVRVGGALTVLLLVAGVAVLLRREAGRRRARVGVTR